MLDVERDVSDDWPDMRANSLKGLRPLWIVFDNLDVIHVGLLPERSLHSLSDHLIWLS